MFLHETLPFGDGTKLDYIRSDKFRFSLLCATLSLGRLTLPEKKALFVLCTLLERTTGRAYTPALYDVRAGMLYNAMVSFGFCEERGGEILLTASADFAGGSIFGEPLIPRIFEFLSESIYEPVVGTEYFEEAFFATLDYIRGNILADSGDAETYAAARYNALSETASKRLSDMLTFEEKLTIPDTVTLGDVISIYEKFLQAPLVYSFFIGKEKKEDVLSGLLEIFPKTAALSLSERMPICTDHTAIISDGPLGNMTRIYRGYAYSCEREAAILLCSYLGSCPSARLFTVLREEKRYCYSVSAYCSSPGIITLSATVGTRVDDKAREAMDDVLAETTQSIDPVVFEAAKKTALLAAAEVFDTRSLCEACCFSAFTGNRRDAFGSAERIAALTEEDIRLAAEGLKLCIDYTCKGNIMPLSARGYTKGAWID